MRFLSDPSRAPPAALGRGAVPLRDGRAQCNLVHQGEEHLQVTVHYFCRFISFCCPVYYFCRFICVCCFVFARAPRAARPGADCARVGCAGLVSSLHRSAAQARCCARGILCPVSPLCDLSVTGLWPRRYVLVFYTPLICSHPSFQARSRPRRCSRRRQIDT
jgi:hypothetical protein